MGPVLAQPVIEAEISGTGEPLAPPWLRAQTESSYIIYTDGTEFFSQDGATGCIFCRDTDAWTVLDATLTELDSEGGGRIYVKPGHYVLTQRLDLISNLLIEGAEGAIIDQDAAVPAFLSDAQVNVTISHLTFQDCAEEAIRLRGGADIRIRDCRFEAIQLDAIANFAVRLERVWIEDCLIDAAGLASDSSGSPHYGGVRLFQVGDVFIRNNVVQFCGGTGISVWSESDRVVIEGNIAISNGANEMIEHGQGICVGGQAARVVIQGNVTQDNAREGICAGAGEGSSAYVIDGNIAIANGVVPGGDSGNNYASGMWITGSATSDVVVSNNVCLDGHGGGIKVGFADEAKRVLVEGNMCGNNGRDSSEELFASGIVLVNPSGSDVIAEEVHITGNIVYDDQITATQVRGIYCMDRVDSVLIEANRLYGNGDGSASQQIEYAASPDVIVRRNIGFATEAGGSFTISSSDVASIAHGLAVTPNRYYLHVTPQGNLAGNSFWVASADATNFEVRLSAPVASPVEFGWSYIAP